MEVNIARGNTAGGMFYHSPLGGTTEPTMPVSPFDQLATPWEEVGLVGEDGPSWTPFGAIEAIRAWSLENVRNVKTERGTMTIPVISTTKESLSTVFGAGAVTETAATASHGKLVKVTTDTVQNENEAFCLIGKDGEEGLMWLCENGMVTEIAEVGMTPTGALIWNITITGDWSFTKDDGNLATGG